MRSAKVIQDSLDSRMQLSPALKNFKMKLFIKCKGRRANVQRKMNALAG